MRRRRAWLACGFAAALLSAAGMRAQTAAEDMRSQGSGESHSAPEALAAAPQAQDAGAMSAEERQQRIQRDTARIAELSKELEADVDKAGPNQLSIEVVRKAAEIERLSKEIRELMKQGK